MRIVAYDGSKQEEERIVAEQLEEGFYLVEIQNITEGNYLGFAESPLRPSDPEETQVQRLQKQVEMLTAKTTALASGQEMQEDVITEIVMHVYE